ncbi:hypothetical protein [Patiriisocius marinus]|nr:hypothetical protein [Patiriisocius marinus]
MAQSLTNCRVGKTYKKKCDAYSVETCGDLISDSFVDYCSLCDKVVG